MRLLQLILIALLGTPAAANSMLDTEIIIERVQWRGTIENEVFPYDQPFVFETATRYVDAGIEYAAASVFIPLDIDVDATTITLTGAGVAGYADSTPWKGHNGLRITVDDPATPRILGATVTNATNLNGFDPDHVHVVDGQLIIGLDGANHSFSSLLEIEVTLGPPISRVTTVDPLAWADATGATVVEDYEGQPNGFVTDEYMDSLYSETSYTKHGWPFDEHQIWQGFYNSSTTSFTMEFDTHSLADQGGVHAVLLEYATFSEDWYARVLHANGTLAVYPLPMYPSTNAPGHFGIWSDSPIARIDVCDGFEPTLPGSTSLFLDSLTVGTLAPTPSCPGDVDGDGDTDTFDFAELALAFGTSPGETNWNANADLVPDGTINTFDFAELAEDFGCSP